MKIGDIKEFVKEYLNDENLDWEYMEGNRVFGTIAELLGILNDSDINRENVEKCIRDLLPNGKGRARNTNRVAFEKRKEEFFGKESLNRTNQLVFDGQKVAVFGIPLERRLGSKFEASLVITETTKKNLQSLAIGVAMKKPILLSGITGSGKSSLVNELAAITNNFDIIKCHLDESFDSKDLLGTYVCTDVPGEFRWQPGALTKAVVEGKWLLIEDLDLAPFDIVTSLSSLLESGKLFIPGRNEMIETHPSFRLFATRTVTETSGHYSKRKNIPLENLWNLIHIEEIPLPEIVEIFRQKYPAIAQSHGTLQKMISSYLVLAGKSDNSPIYGIGRQFSFRDLMKWARRIHVLYPKNLSSSAYEAIFQDGLDLFVGMIKKPEKQDLIVQKLSQIWEMNYQRAVDLLRNHRPPYKETSNLITVGRAILERSTDLSNRIKLNRQSYAKTKQAMRLLERVSVCVKLKEPVLLTGETGTGKTTIVQYLADTLGRKLIVHNLNQQTDSSDFIGGFKPVDMKILSAELQQKFDKLFHATFSASQNQHVLSRIQTYYQEQEYEKMGNLMSKVVQKAFQKLGDPSTYGNLPQKTKQLNQMKLDFWKKFETSLNHFQSQQNLVKNNFAFYFQTGSLVKALREGHWILLDEINLASAETLERLSGLLEGEDGTLYLTEKGDVEPIPRHENFRIFACMNPPTDVGKKDLPPAFRNRFTEFFMQELTDVADLELVASTYLNAVVEAPSTEIVQFYLQSRELAKTKLSDGANQNPNYSLRTFTRALNYTASIVKDYGLFRALYEGFSMSFMTQLDVESRQIMEKLILDTFVPRNQRYTLSQDIQPPTKDDYVRFQHFCLRKGEFPVIEPKNFITTESVSDHLKNLARIVQQNKYPVLLQGPTSAGKTSMIRYLAERTGHKLVRINNHESTDIQEYFGAYITNKEGKLIFQEGILVEAVRKGYWIVLDELNLAPSDILEALNRLLDDNRELFLPETQEVIKPHPHFHLFATQNPPGAYGGRKVLSRAFRNRFQELHVSDIPLKELVVILSRRFSIPSSFAEKMIEVMRRLQLHRQSSRLFSGKHGFITPRDLFKWAERCREREMDKKEFAEVGYMLLAERLRSSQEKLVVKKNIEEVFKLKYELIDEFQMYDCTELPEFKKMQEILKDTEQPIVWTHAMKRLFTLILQCITYREPILLVGETGCGKTTICQLFSLLRKQQLSILNCHQHTESSDFLGSLRPIRGRDSLKESLTKLVKQFCDRAELEYEDDLHYMREIVEEHETSDSDLETLQKTILTMYREFQSLFQWYDGPLVEAMKEGNMFLIDEISLAEDAVLERLNSVLESDRTLFLPEKGNDDLEKIVGHENFLILATMNPGGDYGKKELSPALRNRFTEIYVPALSVENDLGLIIRDRLPNDLGIFADKLVEFVTYFQKDDKKSIVSVRDVICWTEFIVLAVKNLHLNPYEAYLHGAELSLLDGLGIGIDKSTRSILALKQDCVSKLMSQVPDDHKELQSHFKNGNLASCRKSETPANNFGIGGAFSITKGNHPLQSVKYALDAPTTTKNVQKVLRGLQLRKALLLEGSPGVGKTSLVCAIAALSGRKVVRINLSEQTDMMDLLGTDLPQEGASGGEFVWADGILLRALKDGDWVLLDELNLASQSVLEGLNSILDHRAEVFIPELGLTFKCPPSFRVFACQNPLQQGGGRKGLPKSFLNRFTKVYIDEFESEDLQFIVESLYEDIPRDILHKMITFNERMHQETMVEFKFGSRGGPWEFNLRDIFRWCDMMQSDAGRYNPGRYASILYFHRMRTQSDRDHVLRIYKEVFDEPLVCTSHPDFIVSDEFVQIGNTKIQRKEKFHSRHIFLNHLLTPLEILLKSIDMNYMSLLVGPSGSGKSSLVKLAADIVGVPLREFTMGSSTDTTELLGTFEQIDLSSLLGNISQELLSLLIQQAEDIENIADFNRIDLLTTCFRKYNTYINYNNDPSVSRSENDTIRLDMLVQLLQELKSMVSQEQYQRLQGLFHYADKMLHAGTSGKFHWRDGALLTALERGDWLLIDNINFCSPTVLDRLNSLLEPNGFLIVNERGFVDGELKVVKPHPNFRLFFVMNPKFGEISRAMRNRGLEFYVTPIPVDSMDAIHLICLEGIPSKDTAYFLQRFHLEFCDKFFFGGDNHPTIREILRCAKLFMTQRNHGMTLRESFVNAVKTTYISLLSQHKDEALNFVISFSQGLNPPQEQENYPNSYLLTIGKEIDAIDARRYGHLDHFDDPLQYRLRLLYFCLNFQEQESLEILKKIPHGMEMNQDTFSVMNSVLSHPLYRKMLNIRHQAIPNDPLIPYLSLDTRLSKSIWTNLVESFPQAEHNVVVKSVNILISMLYANRKWNNSSRAGIWDDIQNEKLLETVSYLYQTFTTAFNQYIQSDLDLEATKVMEELVSSLDMLWNYLNSPSQLDESFLIYWNNVEKWLSKLRSQSDNMNSIVQRIQQLVHKKFDNLGSKNILWKYGGKPDVYSAKHQDIANDLLQVGENVRDFRQSEINEMILKGLCSLEWVKEQTSTQDEILAQLSRIPELIKSRKINRKRSEEEWIHQLFAKYSKRRKKIDIELHHERSLWPIYEYRSMLFEMQSLQQIQETLFHESLKTGFVHDLSKLKHTIQYVLKNSTRNPSDMKDLQIILWQSASEDVKKVILKNIHPAIASWHQRSWNNSYNKLMSIFSQSKGEQFIGPNTIFQDVKGSIILSHLLNWSKIPIRIRFTKLDQIKEIIKFLGFSEETLPCPHEGDWLRIRLTIVQIVQCFTKEMPPTLNQHLQDYLHRDEKSENLFQILQSCRDDRLIAVVPIFKEIFTLMDNSNHFDLQARGQVWALLALCRLLLVIPAQPVDPTLKYSIMLNEYALPKMNLAESKAKLFSDIEKFLNGGDSNPLIQDVLEEKDVFNKKSERLSLKVVNRPENIPFINLYRDMRQYLSTLLNGNRIQSIIQELKSTGETYMEALAKENSFISISDQFIQKMKTKYSGYEDIWVPFVTGIHELKYGLRLLSYGTFIQHKSINDPIHRLVQKIISFPIGDYTKTISSQMEEINKLLNTAHYAKSKKLEVLSQVLPILLRQIRLEKKLDKKTYRLLHSILETYTALHDQLRELVQEEKDKNEELVKFKKKVEVIETDEMIIEKEMEDMLPSYEHIYEEYQEENPGEEGQSNPISKPVEEKVSNVFKLDKNVNDIENLQFIMKVHKHMFSKAQTIDSLSERKQLIQESFNICSYLLTENEGMFDFNSENQIALLSFASFTSNVLAEKLTPEEKTFDIYRDIAVSEVTIAFHAMNKFVKRLVDLLKKYEENSSLILMIRLSEEILTLPVSSPIIKVLTGIEVLLKKAVDWEEYKTSPAATIQTEIDQLVALMIRWRKMELNNWKSILIHKRRNIAQPQYFMWFNCYKLFNLTSFTVSSPEEEKESLSHVYGILNNFVQGANYGDLSHRIDILSSFLSQFKEELNSETESNRISIELKKRVFTVLQNVVHYYRQFIPDVENAIDKQTKPIAEKLQTFVQLQKWHDTNYWGVASQAQKARRKLAKFSKEFGDILHLSITSVMENHNFPAPEDIEYKKTKSMRLPKTKGVSSCSVAESLSKVRNVVETKLFKHEMLEKFNMVGEDLSELANSLISNSKKVRNPKVGIQNKKLIVRQLCDSLTDMGVMKNIIAKTFMKHTPELLCQKVFVPSDEFNPFQSRIITKCNDYYYKNIYLLEKLRRSYKEQAKENKIEGRNDIVGLAGFLTKAILRQRKDAVRVNDAITLFQDYKDAIERVASRAYDEKLPNQEQFRIALTRYSRVILEFSNLIEQFMDMFSSLKETASLDIASHNFSVFSRVQKQVEPIVSFMNSLEKKYAIYVFDDLQRMIRYAEEMNSVRITIETQVKPLPMPLTALNESIEQLNKVQDIWKSIKLISKGSSLDEQNYVELMQLTVQDFMRQFNNSKDEDVAALKLLIRLDRQSTKSILERSGKLESYLNQTYQQREHWDANTATNMVMILDQFITLCSTLRQPFISLHHQLNQISYIFNLFFGNLFVEGYGEEEEEQEGEWTGETEFQEGTGMDDGEGMEDISKDIKDESELLNDNDTRPQDPNEKMDDNDDAIEMETDFEGTDFNMEKKEGDGSDDEDEESDLDEDMGDIDDNDPNKETLDQKLWEDEERPQKEDDDTNQDANQNPEQQRELAAKEDTMDKPQDNPEQDMDQPDRQQDEEQSEFHQEEFQDEMKDEGQEGEGKEDQHKQDLPPELEFDQGSEDEGENDDHSGDDAMQDEDDPLEEDNIDDNVPIDGEQNQIQNEEDDQNVETEDMQLEDEAEKENEDEETGGNIDPALEDEENHEEDQEPDENIDAQKEAYEQELEEAPYGVQNTAGQSSEIKNEEESLEAQEKERNKGEESGKDVNKTEQGESVFEGQKQPEQENDAPQDAQFDPNPYKALGDVHKEWKEKLNIVENENEENDQGGDDEDAKDVEVKQQGEEKEDDLQMKMPATKEEAEVIPDIEKMQDEDDQENETGSQKSVHEFESKNPQTKDSRKSGKENESELDLMEDEELPEKTEEEEPEEHTEKKEKEPEMSTSHVTGDLPPPEIFEKIDILDMQAIKQLNFQLEQDLNEWRKSSENVKDAADKYQLFDSQTSHLSQELCEQLRIILEPSLATKLKGDYKTGKRINMKKVIPYIASQFRKDKIWMRRTKPNKREYQVMVAIDDSLSMKDNDSGDMALRALILISKALTKLEVGQISIVSFGEEMKLLHPFDKPFNDQCGQEVVGQFSFSQKQTQVVKLLTQISSLLDVYKVMQQSQSGADQMQLTILISDGRLLEGDTVLRMVRQAQLKNQLFLFVILDDFKNSESIMDITNVSYDEGKLQYKKYMEEFPFTYYVVLKDIQQMPEILADTLKQWFQADK